MPPTAVEAHQLITHQTQKTPRKASPKALEAKGLTKIYTTGNKTITALDNIDLEVPVGSIFALLGPNGAGKSTFINTLAGLVRKTSGSLKVMGVDIDTHRRNAKAQVGVVLQELEIDPYFTPAKLLDLQAGLYAVKHPITAQLLEAVSLTKQRHYYTRSLSGGMKRRLMIAKAMVHAPPVLVLDEPTAGVDVELRLQLWELIAKLARLGITVLLTTHYIYEAEKLCDRVAIINNGKVIACDTTDALLAKISKREATITLSRQTSKTVARRMGAEYLNPHQLKFGYRYGEFGKITHKLTKHKLQISEVETAGTDLEKIFINLTSK